MRVLWVLPAVHALSSALSDYYYGRHLFVLARLQPLTLRARLRH